MSHCFWSEEKGPLTTVCSCLMSLGEVTGTDSAHSCMERQLGQAGTGDVLTGTQGENLGTLD